MRLASMRLLLVAWNAVAVPELAPIFKVPELTDCTTKATTLPSTSASLPWAIRLLKLIGISVLLAPLAKGVVRLLKLGASLTGLNTIVVLAAVLERPSLTP